MSIKIYFGQFSCYSIEEIIQSSIYKLPLLSCYFTKLWTPVPSNQHPKRGQNCCYFTQKTMISEYKTSLEKKKSNFCIETLTNEWL